LLRNAVEDLKTKVQENDVGTSISILAMARRIEELEKFKEAFDYLDERLITLEQTVLQQETNDPVKPDSSLVKRVQQAIDAGCPANEARAAIHEVANWLKEQGCYPHSWLAQTLELEAEK